MKKRVTIIGGGVVGLSLAYALIKENIAVTVIDQKDGIGQGASFANGAQLSYRYVSPLADKGIPLQGLKWLAFPKSPLNLRLKLSLSQWKWLAQFTLACNQRTNQINGKNILRLSLLSQTTLSEWRKNDDLADFDWKKSGKIVFYRNHHEFKVAASKIDPQFQQIFTPEEVCAKEPALSSIQSDIKGAIYSPDDETANAYLYCVSLLKKLQSFDHFTLLTNTEVLNIHKKHSIISHISTSHGDLAVDELVIASGNGATSLLNPIGIRLPIYPLQGYSLTLPFPTERRIAPNISVTDYGHKTVYARLGEYLRIAAMVDIGYNGTIRENRIQALKKTVHATFPELQGVNDAIEWCGMRPSTPKGPPILGKTSYDNLWLNVGHGSLGFTLAAGSATVLTALILNRTSPIQLNGLSL